MAFSVHAACIAIRIVVVSEILCVMCLYEIVKFFNHAVDDKIGLLRGAHARDITIYTLSLRIINLITTE